MFEKLVKISKADAKYEFPALPAHKDEPCRKCEYFEQIAPNHCAKVQGIILPTAHCRLWEEK
jgi:hypothetical protein